MEEIIEYLIRWFDDWFFAKPEPIVPDVSLPPKAPEVVQPTKLWWEIPNPSTDWGGRPNVYPENLQQLFILKARQFAQIEGLTPELTEDFIATIWSESGVNPYCENKRTFDYGIAQFNKNTYLKEYKMTPSDAIQNPEKCLQIMAHNFKTIRRNNWVAFSSGGYKHFLNNFNPYHPKLGGVEYIPEKWR